MMMMVLVIKILVVVLVDNGDLELLKVSFSQVFRVRRGGGRPGHRRKHGG